MLKTIQNAYHPNVVTLFNPSDEPDTLIYKLSPWLEHQPAISGKATAYVCQDFACKSPTTSINEMQKLSGQVSSKTNFKNPFKESAERVFLFLVTYYFS